MVNMKNSIPIRNRRSSGPGRESGIAMIMALLCLFVISTLAVGIMYSTQSEIWTTANYRAATQARYMAEAGAQQALNYLMYVPFTPPAIFTTTGQTTFSLNTVPIMYLNSTPKPLPMIFATSGISSRYADTSAGIGFSQVTALDTAFLNYFTLQVTRDPYKAMVAGCSGSGCPHFEVAAQLLTATQNPNSGTWLMRWKIVSEGSLNTINGKAMVQVVEVVDNVNVIPPGGASSSPTYAAGVAVTGTGCGSITMSGGTSTNSYVGATQVGVNPPVLANTGGDVSTFGNINLSGGSSIIGSVSTPFYNAGISGTYGISGGTSHLNGDAVCDTTKIEYAVNYDRSGSGVNCTAKTVGCSATTKNISSPPPSYPTPIMPSSSSTPSVGTNTAACINFNGLCASGSGGGSGCAISFPPSFNPDGTAGTNSDGTAGAGIPNFGKVTFAGCAKITLSPGTYNMDSLTVTSGATVYVPATGGVVINILDQGATPTPLSLSGGTMANNGGNPANLTIVYAGAKPIDIGASAAMYGTIYAPNSAVTMSGTGALYGALVANKATFGGSGTVDYDSSLAGTHWHVNTGPPSPVPGALHVDEFSWSAF
jgi:hypothetical protein